MELPDLVLVLIGLAIAGAAFVVTVMNLRREHALRERFAEEYERVLGDHRRNRRDF